MKDGQINHSYSHENEKNNSGVVVNLHILSFSIEAVIRQIGNMCQVVLTCDGKVAIALVMDKDKKAVVYSSSSPRKAKMWMLKKYYSAICTE